MAIYSCFKTNNDVSKLRNNWNDYANALQIT
jgi:hypothetical protein